MEHALHGLSVLAELLAAAVLAVLNFIDVLLTCRLCLCSLSLSVICYWFCSSFAGAVYCVAVRFGTFP